MTQTTKELQKEHGKSNGEAKTRKPPVYKLTLESFEKQIKILDPKQLFAFQNSLEAELDRRRKEANALVEELKGGK